MSVLNTVQISTVNATSDLGFSWIAREPGQRLATARAGAKASPGDCPGPIPDVRRPAQDQEVTVVIRLGLAIRKLGTIHRGLLTLLENFPVFDKI